MEVVTWSPAARARCCIQASLYFYCVSNHLLGRIDKICQRNGAVRPNSILAGRMCSVSSKAVEEDERNARRRIQGRVPQVEQNSRRRNKQGVRRCDKQAVMMYDSVSRMSCFAFVLGWKGERWTGCLVSGGAHQTWVMLTSCQHDLDMPEQRGSKDHVACMRHIIER